MAEPDTFAAALTAWEERGIEELDLPSGMRVKVARASLPNLMVAGIFRQPIMDAFLGSEEGAALVDAESSPPRSRAGFEVMTRTIELVAESIRAIWHDGEWRAGRVSVERFVRMPLGDQAAIRKVALGEEEEPAGLAEFRPDATGNGAGDNGAGVPAAAEPSHGPNRAGRRARPRSDARA